MKGTNIFGCFLNNRLIAHRLLYASSISASVTVKEAKTGRGQIFPYNLLMPDRHLLALVAIISFTIAAVPLFQLQPNVLMK